MLNLKEAQIVTDNEHKPVSETRHRLLGMKNLFQAHKPELVLKFKIEETVTMKSSNQEELLEKVIVDSNFQSGDSTRIEMFQNQLHGHLQIGPPHLCTEFYELAVNVLSVGNLSNIMPKERVDTPIKAHFVIFGYSFFTKDLSVFREHMSYGRISIKIWSQLHFIAAYFKEFPKLLISIYSEEDIVGTAIMNLQVLGNLTTKRNIMISDKIQIDAMEETDEFHSKIDLPFLEMEFQLFHKKDFISTKVDQETQSNCDNFEKEPGNSTQFSPPSIRYENSLASHKEDVEETGISVKNSAEPIVANHTDENNIISIQNLAPDIHREHSNSSEIAVHDEYNSPSRKDYSKKDIKGATIKICEELEDWKEKQQEMFRFELKKKTDRHLKKLSNEWLKKKFELEEDLKKRIEDCQMLKEKLINALEDLTQRSEQLAVKEEELKIAKEELDKKYTMKFQELRKASKLHEFDMEDKIHEATAEKAELYKKLEESRKEILRLQDALLNQEVPNHHSKEQTANLISEIRSLEQKLEKAVESKTFFKEQWGKAVRELHRMKEEEQQQLKWQIQKNRQELQTLGLVKEISQEVGEMKKDQSTIKNIRNELANFISVNNESLMDRFQNTY